MELAALAARIDVRRKVAKFSVGCYYKGAATRTLLRAESRLGGWKKVAHFSVSTARSLNNISGPQGIPPVNKRVLSTGETGEFARENEGFGINPDASLPTRENARRARTCGMLRIRAEGRRGALLSTKRSLGVGAEKNWPPQKPWFPPTSPARKSLHLQRELKIY